MSRILAVALVGALAGTAVAAMQVKMTTAGGAFPQSPYTAEVVMGPIGENAQGSTFDTFCLERNVNFSPNVVYDATVDAGAINGGVNGGNPDPVSLQTAWLYDAFLDASDATVAAATANDIQFVVWVLEQEEPLANLNATQTTLYNYVLANAAALTGGKSVFAMNLWQGGAYTGTDIQSMLVRSVIPVPGAALLGLVGLAALRRMR